MVMAYSTTCFISYRWLISGILFAARIACLDPQNSTIKKKKSFYIKARYMPSFLLILFDERH
jgi:hypothetical protein